MNSRVDDCDEDGDVVESSLHASKSCVVACEFSSGKVRLSLSRSQTSSKFTVEDGVGVLEGASPRICELDWNAGIF